MRALISILLIIAILILAGDSKADDKKIYTEIEFRNALCDQDCTSDGEESGFYRPQFNDCFCGGGKPLSDIHKRLFKLKSLRGKSFVDKSKSYPPFE